MGVNFCACAEDGNFVDGFDGAFGLAACIPEGRKIMLPDQHLRGPVHGVSVEGDGDAPEAAFIQRELHAPINEAVEIAPLDRVKTAMPLVMHYLSVEHRNGVFGHMEIHRVADFVGAYLLVQIHMRDLAERMDAAIRAARAVNQHVFALIYFRRRGLHHALNARPMVLPLPAHIRRAVIFNGEFIAGH